MRRNTRKSRVTDAKRFKLVTKISTLENVDQKMVDRFVTLAEQIGYAPRTIGSSIAAVELFTGRKFRKPKTPSPPLKYIPPLADLGRLYNCGDSWVQRFVAFAYTTGLRFSDLLLLREEHLSECRSQIRLVISKTGREAIIPIPEVMQCHYEGRPIEWDSFNRSRTEPDYFVRIGRKQAYGRLKSACSSLGIRYASPHAIRRRAACEYETAYPGAGRAILGHSPTVTGRYIPDLVYLERAQERLAIPWERADRSGEKQLTAAFRRLSQSDRETVLKMVSRLA